MDIQEMIANHTNSIVSGNINSPDIACRRCLQRPEFFKLHECRKRQFRITVENVVKVTFSFLLRWQCLLCGATFTDYPPFAVPHKRFVLTDILKFGQAYLENDNMSYRSVVRHNGTDIGYPDAHGLCDRFLSHSSVWRFVTYLASMYKSHRPRDISEKTIPFISFFKYRSNHRRALLYKAFQIIILFNREATIVTFPNFETGPT